MKVFQKFGSSAFKVNEVRTPDELAELSVWNKLKDTEILQFNSAISRVKFSPVAPFSIVSLSGLSAPFVHGKTRAHKFSFAKTKAPFSAVAFGRKDGSLIALGREDSTVDTYPVSDHQSLHRRWKLDSGIIFGLAFSPFSNHILAGCGNGSIKLLDIGTRETISLDNAHRDAVTSIVPLESGNMWVTAGNDGMVKVWDMNPESRRVIAEVETDNPVSHLAIKGTRVFAASGESVVVIDVQSKTTRVHEFVAHTRGIVGMAISRSNLVTASSDRTIRVWDPTTFNILHTMKLYSNITAFDILPDASAIAIGLTGGVLQIKYAVQEEETGPAKRTVPMPAGFRVFERQPERHDAPWNKSIRDFDFDQALDQVLETENADEIIGLLDELDRLGKLEAAIGGREADNLVPLLRFLVNNCTNFVWSHVCLKAVIAVEKIYRAVIGDDPKVGDLFDELLKVIEEELETQKRAARLVGQIDILLS